MKTAYIIDWQDYQQQSVLYLELRKFVSDNEMGQNTYREWWRGEEDDEEYPAIAELVDLMCPDINLPIYIHCWW